jgi:hypothetical protein
LCANLNSRDRDVKINHKKLLPFPIFINLFDIFSWWIHFANFVFYDMFGWMERNEEEKKPQKLMNKFRLILI